MLRRFLLGILLMAAWFTGTVLGVTGAAFRTRAGRQVMVEWGLQTANRWLQGSLTLGEVGGSFFRGLEIRGMAVFAADGSPVITAERVGIRYGIRDLFRGRIVFGSLRLERPEMHLVQVREGAPLNLVSLFPSGDGGGAGPLVAFGEVRISDGRVVVMTPVPKDGSGVLESVSGPDGDLQVRRLENLDGELAYLRVASPEPNAPILAVFDRLRTEVTDPAVRVRDLQGSVQLWGDSVRLDITDFSLPETRGEVEGLVRWPDGPLLLDIRGRAAPGLTDDVLGLVPTLPAGLSGAARFTVTSPNADALAFTSDGLDLRSRDGGEMRGRLGMVLGPGEQWAFTDTDLQMVQFDLEYFRGYLDTLPFAGRLTGRIAADGSAERLTLRIDATFFDGLVADWPVSSVLGRGIVSLRGDDFVFDRFTVSQADIDLRSVRRLVPSVTVEGRLWTEGVLDGSWRNARFDGDLRYADPPLSDSRAHGWVQMDARGDTTGMWAELALDSLRFESFHSSFEGFDLQGAWSGTLRLAGYLDSLEFDADLEGPAGAMSAVGALFALRERRGMHSLHVTTQGLDLASLTPTLPETRLDGDLDAAALLRADSTFDVSGQASLRSSAINDVAVERAHARFAVSDAVLRLDTLRLSGYGLEIDAAGAIGLGGQIRDTLRFTATTDSIGVLEPLLTRLFGSVEDTAIASRPSGTARVSGHITGSSDAFQLFADFDASNLRRGSLHVSRAGGTATWVSDTRTVHVEARADSVAGSGIALGRPVARIHGQPESLQWFGRARHGFGGWLGGGTWAKTDSSSVLVVDSLALSLESGPWIVDSGAAIILDDGGVSFVGVSLRNVRGPGRAAISGRWPFQGPGSLGATVDALQIADLLVLAFQDPDLASGELSGTVTMAGRARAPIIEAHVSLRNAAYRDFHVPYTQGTLRYQDLRLVGDLELRRLGEQILRVTAGLPVDLALSGAASRRLPGPISVRAEADSAHLEMFEAITPMVRDLSGTVDASFGIAGTWEDPQLTGYLRVSDGAATLPDLGVRHEDVNGSLVLAGDTIKVQDLSLRSGVGGGRIGGFVRLEELTRPMLNLTVQAEDLHALNLPGFLDLTVTGSVELQGPMYAATLTGRGTATRGVLYFADLLRKDIVNLEDALFAEFVDTSLIRREGLGAEIHNRMLDSLRIDSLRLGVGENFWLRSSEANVQLAGALLVNKVRDVYRLNGTLEARRGTYRLQLGLGNSREFSVTGGEIRYLGTPDLNADLDVDAEHVVRTTLGEDLRVFVNIGGTLYDPRLRLTSEFLTAGGPSRGLALSEPEIINYLLFGAPTLEAGASQSGFESRLVTQQVFGALSGQIEYSLITDMGVPLDYLQIRPTTSLGGLTGFQAAFGKQFQVLGTTAFLSASPHFCSKEQLRLEGVGAGLEFRLNRQWLISASVDPLRSCEIGTAWTAPNYQFGADLFWEKRF